MGFLIDTDIWVAVERGALSPADIRALTGTEPVFLSPVNVAELQMGIGLVEDEATCSPQVLQRPSRCIRSWYLRCREIGNAVNSSLIVL